MIAPARCITNHRLTDHPFKAIEIENRTYSNSLIYATPVTFGKSVCDRGTEYRGRGSKFTLIFGMKKAVK